MDIVKREETGVAVSRRKKRNKEERKSIFEIYRSQKLLKIICSILKTFSISYMKERKE